MQQVKYNNDYLIKSVKKYNEGRVFVKLENLLNFNYYKLNKYKFLKECKKLFKIFVLLLDNLILY